ncbi:MAG: hypothetical protein JSU68_13275, partial [Phycisphaerales bacterium]
IEAYQDEFNRSQQPGYQPPAYDGEYGDNDSAEDLEADQEHIAEPADEDVEEQSDEFTSLIAGLNRDAESHHDERRRREQSQRRGGGSERAAPVDRPRRPAKAATGSSGSALDDFLSKLGSSGGGPRKRGGGRRGQGSRRRERPQGQPSPGGDEVPRASGEPEPVPAAPVQPPEEEAQPDNDDFGAGIL